MAQAHEITAHILWYQSILRPCAQQIIRHTLGTKVFVEISYTEEEKSQRKSELINFIFKALDKQLIDKGRKFIVSNDDICFVDIHLYTEIS